MAIAVALSGCSSSSTVDNPTVSGGSSTAIATASAVPATGGSDKITVSDTASKVTVTGGSGEKLSSDAFKLSKDGWYIITIKYSAAGVTNFIADVVTQADIDNDETVAGLLPMMLESGTDTIIETKGSYQSDDYKIYLEKAEGPWSIEIQKSPSPQPSGQTSFSHKASDSLSSVTPYFALKQGTATFTITQHIDTSKWQTPIEAKLINADTGDLATYLVHNSDDETQTATYDVPADGNYIMEVTCGGDWEISYTE